MTVNNKKTSEGGVGSLGEGVVNEIRDVSQGTIMESLEGPNKKPEFISKCDKLKTTGKL